MAGVQESLDRALQINGALGAALVDFKTGMCLGTAGGDSAGFDLELAAAGNTEVVRAKKDISEKLGLNMSIEDILITLGGQFHLIRMLHENSNVFLYLVLDRNKANLALARMELEKVDGDLEI